MEKYSSYRDCPKCGMIHPKDEFVPEIAEQKVEEHILRTCRNCGYSWKESPIDRQSIPK